MSGWREPLLKMAPWALGCLFVAGVVHIVSVLAMPHLAQKDAYSQLGGATDSLTLLPAPTQTQSMPFQDPSTVLGICRYDLDAGATRIRATAPGDGLLTISIHDRLGRIFYSTTDRAALRGKIDIRLLDAAQLDTLEANDPDDQTPQELRLVAPTRTGFILVRALIERPGMETAATQALQSVVCQTEQNEK